MSGTYTIGRIGLVIRGAYSAATAYTPLDVVGYNGSSYACKEACTNIVPTNASYWMLLAQGDVTGTHDHTFDEVYRNVSGSTQTLATQMAYLDTLCPSEWTNLTITDSHTTTSSSAYGNGVLRWRHEGNHVFVEGGITSSYTGSAKTICTIPMPPSHSNVYYLKACSGARIARLFVHKPTGNLRLEWVKYISSGSNDTSFNNWIDCRLDYWTD